MSTDAPELTGRVVNGIVELDQRGKLTDRTEVRVRPVVRTPKAEGTDASLSKMLLSFAGTIELSPSVRSAIRPEQRLKHGTGD